MRPDVPILMITLQIPVVPDISAEQVLEAIGEQVSEALKTAKEQQAAEQDAEPEPDTVSSPDDSVLAELTEPFSEETRPDLLAALGYATPS